jgi:hypothetical protein
MEEYETSQFLWNEMDFKILIWASFNKQDWGFFKLHFNELEQCLNNISRTISFKAVFTF